MYTLNSQFFLLLCLGMLMPLYDAFGNAIHGRALILGGGESWNCVVFCCKTNCYLWCLPWVGRRINHRFSHTQTVPFVGLNLWNCCSELLAWWKASGLLGGISLAAWGFGRLLWPLSVCTWKSQAATSHGNEKWDCSANNTKRISSADGWDGKLGSWVQYNS